MNRSRVGVKKSLYKIITTKSFPSPIYELRWKGPLEKIERRSTSVYICSMMVLFYTREQIINVNHKSKFIKKSLVSLSDEISI